jgi:class 3 adenylate cyclase/tetratricopeptide (TPR) repeat protein
VEARKTVTVLFCDWVGSTEIGERLDPESLRRVQSEWFELAERTLHEHGGTVEKFIGDAVMAVFGLPDAHEDDALRAVRAASSLRRGMVELNERFERDLGVRLAARTGIATGLAMTGDPTLRQSLVTGDVVNTAKRLEAAAGADEIVVGAATRALVASAATLEPLPDVDAKGKRDAVAAWRVVAVDVDAPGIERRLDSPLVDRVEELTRLRAVVDQALAERRAVVATVVGPAGVGKSRLVHELVGGLSGHATVLAGRCVAYGGTTYRPLVEILRNAGGPEAVARALAGEENEQLLAELLEAAGGLSSATFTADEIFWAVRRFVEVNARDRLVVLVVDDAHWAEPTFHDLIDYLAAFVTEAPVALIRLGRPELLDRRPGPSGTETIELGPLIEADARELLAEVGAPESARAEILAAAEGNPLFLEQLAAVAADGGPGSLPIPPTIEAVLAARLDQLPRRELSLLEHASVIGRRFEPRVLAELTAPEEAGQVTSTLIGLTRAGLVRPAPGRLGEDRYRFAHGLVRDAAYARIPKSTRASLHEALARRLLADPARTPGADDLAGYHLEQACRALREIGGAAERARELGEEAAALLQEAGRHAFARDDMPAAADLLGRAAALLAVGGVERLNALRDRALALWEAGEADQGIRALDQLYDEAIAASHEQMIAFAELERVVHEQLTGADVAPVQAAAERVIELGTTVGDDAAVALAWRRISSARRRAGEYAAAEVAARRALEHARAARDSREEARAVDGLCNSLLYGPTPVEVAVETCGELLAGGTTRTLEANVTGVMAGLQAMRGAFDDARGAYRRAAATLEELGLELARAALTQIGVPLELLAGDPLAAEREARKGAEIFSRFGSSAVQVPLIAEALYAQGRFPEAARALDTTGVESGPAIAPWQVRWRIVAARLAIADGRPADAVGVASTGVEFAERTDDLNLRADALAAAADALLAAGRPDESADAIARARACYDTKGNIAAAAMLPAPAPSSA